MTSAINSATIDAAYPVAGVDNDSQGFRDNFTSIKNNLSTAASEITTLQADTAKLNADNDFNGNIISEADFKATTEFVYPGGSIVASQNISFLNGHYQKIEVGNDVTLTLADWPAEGKLGKIRLEIKASDSGSHTITWNPGAGNLFKAPSGDPATLTVSSNANPVFVDFWTTSGGDVTFRKTGEVYV